jgi:hypothetical protein
MEWTVRCVVARMIEGGRISEGEYDDEGSSVLLLLARVSCVDWDAEDGQRTKLSSLYEALLSNIGTKE